MKLRIFWIGWLLRHGFISELRKWWGEQWQFRGHKGKRAVESIHYSLLEIDNFKSTTPINYSVNIQCQGIINGFVHQFVNTWSGKVNSLVFVVFEILMRLIVCLTITHSWDNYILLLLNSLYSNSKEYLTNYILKTCYLWRFF